MGLIGGRTWTYSGFDPSAYDQLYYGVGDYGPSFNAAGPALTMDGSTDRLSFDAAESSLATGKVVWSGQTSASIWTGSSYSILTVPTRFTLLVTDLASNALALTSVSSPAFLDGVPSSLGGVLDVSGSFKANWLFEADSPLIGGITWFPAKDLFNSLHKIPGTQLAMSVGGAFYSTPPIPEPQEWLMLVAGLGLVGWVAWRRGSSAANIPAR